MKLSTALFGLALALFSGFAAAQWQWLDKDQRKVFSDRAPPPEIPEKNILKRPGIAPKESTAEAAPAASSPKPSGVDKDIEAKKKQASDAQAASAKAEQDKALKAKNENCARAKQAKATLDSGVRLSRTNAAGELEILDDGARLAEGKHIQGAIDSNCK